MVILCKARPAPIVGAVPYPGTPQPSPMVRPEDSPYWPLTERCGGHWRSDNNGAEAEAFCEAGPIPNQQGSFLYTTSLQCLLRQSSETQSKMIIRLAWQVDR